MTVWGTEVNAFVQGFKEIRKTRFAFALLRCGTPEGFERRPEQRLRLTIGLRKAGGRWTVTHEHHSFADATRPPEVSAAEVRAVHEQWSARTAAKDLGGLMEHIAPDVVSYEQAGRLQYTGIGEVREVCRRGLESSPGRIDFDVPDLTVRADGDLAVAWGLDRVTADGAESQHRRRSPPPRCTCRSRWKASDQPGRTVAGDAAQAASIRSPEGTVIDVPRERP